MIQLLLASLLLLVWRCNACTPGELLGPCTCIQDELGELAVICSNVYNGYQLQDVFVNLVQTDYLSSATIRDSPQLEALQPNTFGDVKISEIQFFNTAITDIEESVFSPTMASSVNKLDKMENLLLSHNAVSSLHGTLMPTKVSYMDLNNNMISSIGPTYFAPANNISTILLGYNKLSSEVLTYQTLLVYSPTGQLYLNLGWNSLTNGITIDAFGDGTLPKELILSGNGMSTLEENTFGPLLNEMFNNYGTEAYILLDNNPLTCDCTMSWIVQHSARDLIKQAECTDGRLIENLTNEDFLNCNII